MVTAAEKSSLTVASTFSKNLKDYPSAQGPTFKRPGSPSSAKSISFKWFERSASQIIKGQIEADRPSWLNERLCLETEEQ